jgi:hypothetical protein
MVTDPAAPPSLKSNWTSRGESQTSALSALASFRQLERMTALHPFADIQTHYPKALSTPKGALARAALEEIDDDATAHKLRAASFKF